MEHLHKKIDTFYKYCLFNERSELLLKEMFCVAVLAS